MPKVSVAALKLVCIGLMNENWPKTPGKMGIRSFIIVKNHKNYVCARRRWCWCELKNVVYRWLFFAIYSSKNLADTHVFLSFWFKNNICVSSEKIYVRGWFFRRAASVKFARHWVKIGCWSFSTQNGGSRKAYKAVLSLFQWSLWTRGLSEIREQSSFGKLITQLI